MRVLILTNPVFVACAISSEQVYQLVLAVIEQLNGNLEGLRIMSARALSDAATQYCEIVELTDLIKKYELQ